jgi:hypothetical protein
VANLLGTEPDGLGIDFTDTTYFDSETSSQLWNHVRTSSVDSFESPHTFYTNGGTSPKVVKTSATGLGWSPHNMFLNSPTPATQDVTLVVGFVYTITVTGAGGGDITGSAGASGTATTGSPATFTATTTTGTFTLTGSLDTIQLNRGIVGTAYIATAAAIVNGLPISYGEGLLVEPAATNLLIQSEDISTTWTNSNSTESTDATTAPDGSTTADKLVEASDVGQIHSIDQTSASVTSGTTYIFSCYLKAAERSWARLSGATTRFADNFFCDFRLASGTIGTAGSGATISGIESIGDGWYRCWIGAACDSTGTNVMSVIIGEGDGDVTYDGDGASGIYVWGAQLQSGTVPTSYVPTVLATATRAIDLPNVATSAYPHSATEGTFICWMTPRFTNNPVTNIRVINIGNGTANEVISISYLTADSPDAAAAMGMVDGGVNQTDNTATKAGSASLNGNRVAAFYKLNDSGVLVDGGSEVVDTSCTMPTMSSLQLMYATDVAAKQFNGFMRRLVYFPRRMTEAEMQLLTTQWFTDILIMGQAVL